MNEKEKTTIIQECISIGIDDDVKKVLKGMKRSEFKKNLGRGIVAGLILSELIIIADKLSAIGNKIDNLTKD